MIAKPILVSSLTAVLLWSAMDAHAQTPLGSEFTYQGQLKLSGAPLNDTADFEFTLWDADVGGNPIGSTVTLNDVSVMNGLFTGELDFGVLACNGDARWLESAVRSPAGSGAFTTLSPRQELTPAPHAIRALEGVGPPDTIEIDTTTGWVGIGTTSPYSLLDVRGALRSSRSSGQYLEILNSSAAAGNITNMSRGNNKKPLVISSVHDGIGTPGGETYISVRVGDANLPTTALTIREDTKVGIGTTNPSKKLHVVTSRQSDWAVYGHATFSGVGASRGGYFQADGMVGIGVLGKATGSAGVGVAGSADGGGTAVTGFASGSNSTAIEGNGMAYDFYASGPGANYGSSSSIRWKSNIEPIDNPLDKMAQLRGVCFDWDSEHGGHHDVGMIAEEVGKVLPEIVQYEENGVDANGMDYSKMTPLLVEAVNALRTEKDSQIAALQDENDALRSRLESLEQLVERIASQQENEQ